MHCENLSQDTPPYLRQFGAVQVKTMPPPFFKHTKPAFMFSNIQQNISDAVNTTTSTLNCMDRQSTWTPEVVIALLTLIISLPWGLLNLYRLIAPTRTSRCVCVRRCGQCISSPSKSEKMYILEGAEREENQSANNQTLVVNCDEDLDGIVHRKVLCQV